MSIRNVIFLLHLQLHVFPLLVVAHILVADIAWYLLANTNRIYIFMITILFYINVLNLKNQTMKLKKKIKDVSTSLLDMNSYLFEFVTSRYLNKTFGVTYLGCKIQNVWETTKTWCG